MDLTAAAVPEELPVPVVELFMTSGGVVAKWGESGAKQTTAPLSTLYTDSPYLFYAVDSNGDEPFIKTFGSLLHCDGGALTIGQIRYRIQVQKQQDRVPLKTNILGDGVLDKLKSAVVYFVDKSRKPIGTGFFVSPNIAISAAHTFIESTKVGTKRTGYFGKPHIGRTCQLVVDFIDWTNDFIVFVTPDGREATEYLAPASVSLEAGDECILVAYQIGIHDELKELGKEPSVGVFQGAITKAHNRHFVYSAPSFAGDSGGAIILRGGQAIGMHIMTVNQASELQRLASLNTEEVTTGDLADHVNSIEESVGSLIQSLSSGALGLSISAIMAAYQSEPKRKGS